MILEKNQYCEQIWILRTIKILRQGSERCGYPNEKNCKSFKFSVEALLEENRFLITENYEFEFRNVMKNLRLSGISCTGMGD